MKNQEVRLWEVHIMVKIIMCRKKANKDKVIVSKKDASRGRSKSRGKKDIQCHFCDKFGHLKKDY